MESHQTMGAIKNDMEFTITHSTDISDYIRLNWKHRYYVNPKHTKKQYERGITFYFAHQATDDSFYYFGVGGKVIGYAVVRDRRYSKKLDKHFPWLWLNMLFLEPEYRGKGMGTKILEYFKQLVRDTPHKTELYIDIDIEKETKNRLFKWYSKEGFVYDKKNPDDGNILMVWKSEDWVEYER